VKKARERHEVAAKQQTKKKIEMISFHDSRRAEYADGLDWMPEKQALRGVSALLREGLVVFMVILFTAIACPYLIPCILG